MKRSVPSVFFAVLAASFAQARTQIPINVGAQEIPNVSVFETLSKRADEPGAPQVAEVKFLLTGLDGTNSQLWFVNSKTFSYHYDFFTSGLGNSESLEAFSRDTYFTDRRKNLAGTILFHSSWKGAANQAGLYTVEFWPTDPVAPNFIALAYKRIAEKMAGCAAGRIAYHANSETQRAIAKDHASELSQAGVVSISTEELFGNITYMPMNPGVSFGFLRIMDGSSTTPATARDIVVFKTLPNDLGHVSGAITEEPQTPLSHVNLKSKQNKTPNCYLKNATQDPRVLALSGKLVRYEAKPDGIDLSEASATDVATWLAKVRPKTTQKAVYNLRFTSIQPFSRLGSNYASAFGAKTANIAELLRFLPSAQVDVPNGWGIPFSFYDQFMKANGFYDRVRELLKDSTFMTDPAVKEQKLKELRDAIREAPIPEQLSLAIAGVGAQFPQGLPIRTRSSTNNEDLIGFSGAGLYDSYTYRPGKSSLEKTVKKVWASMWNFRAFEERDFFRIDHFSAMMGVTLHGNQDDELANGVIVTKNIYQPDWPGFYYNVQVGENLVTNPEGPTTPDEFLVAALGENGEYETQYIGHSNVLPAGQTVLSPAQIATLTQSMEKVQDHFKRVYGKTYDPKFAMDVEFKVTKEGRLLVKQARPWVD